jgi:hypothetical protein
LTSSLRTDVFFSFVLACRERFFGPMENRATEFYVLAHVSRTHRGVQARRVPTMFSSLLQNLFQTRFLVARKLSSIFPYAKAFDVILDPKMHPWILPFQIYLKIRTTIMMYRHTEQKVLLSRGALVTSSLRRRSIEIETQDDLYE